MQIAIEIVEQLRTIQLLTREVHFSTCYAESISKAAAAYKKGIKAEAVLYSLATSSGFFTDMSSYGLGIYLIYHGLTTATEVYTYDLKYLFYVFFSKIKKIGKLNCYSLLV